jgi:hypothetical protein
MHSENYEAPRYEIFFNLLPIRCEYYDEFSLNTLNMPFSFKLRDKVSHPY